MEGKRLVVSASSPDPDVARKRREFDRHIEGCSDCQPALCFQAQTLWRGVCLTALKARSYGGAR